MSRCTNMEQRISRRMSWNQKALLRRDIALGLPVISLESVFSQFSRCSQQFGVPSAVRRPGTNDCGHKTDGGGTLVGAQVGWSTMALKNYHAYLRDAAAFLFSSRANSERWTTFLRSRRPAHSFRLSLQCGSSRRPQTQQMHIRNTLP